MRGNQLLNKMELIHPIYIEAADTKPKRKKNRLIKWCAAAACFCLVFIFAVPAMAAAIPGFYDALCAISPATAQFFRPVQLSCEDHGIRMEVEAAYIHKDTAEIYISMQDLEGTRIDESIDLFDSYQINTPFSCTGHCELVNFDPTTQTATFLVTIEQWDEKNITGDKLTFSIREFLSHKQIYKGVIRNVDFVSIELNTTTQTVHPRGISGIDLLEDHKNSDMIEECNALKPLGSITPLVEGATLTSIGYIDGNLHIQVYYEDILKTDNHGTIALQNKETKEMIRCDGYISFFDQAEKGSYEDYIFTGITADTLGEYELYGDFTTSSGSISGNWSVTFPLEDTDRK